MTRTATTPLQMTLDGRLVTVEVSDDSSLLDVLREQCGAWSLKRGCQPQGQCGSCLVLIDGKAKTSCALPARKAAGASILTLAGLDAEDRRLLAEAFERTAGLQCGFCIPGIALKAKHLVDGDPRPTRDRIEKALDVHLCRCTGYTKIIEAVEAYAAARRGEPLPPQDDSGRVGTSWRRAGAREMTLGDRPYVDDMTVPGMLHGAVVLAPVARALIRRIDTSAARAAEGVVAVATWRDVPGDRWVGLIEADWPVFVAEGEETRCVGDVLAVVAAETEAQARAAAALVRIDYEELDGVFTAREALAPGAHQVNPRHPNLLSVTAFARGDVDGALAASAHVVRGTWRTQRIEHLFLEPEAALAVPTADGGLHLYTQGQGIFDDRRQVASVLALEEEKLFVELVPSGGAFGGKEDMSIQAQTALLATMTGRPVKLTLDRTESIRLHPKRHPIDIELEVGCDAAGELTALRARLLGDTGAYASVGAKVLERAAGHVCGPYRVPAIDVVAQALYTNNPPCGAMRGFGANQAAFAIEGAMDMLAEKVGLDGWEIRWRNAVGVGDMVATGQVLEKSVGLKRTLEAVRPAYERARAAGRAVGIACGIKNCGLGNGAVEWGKARLVVEPDGRISLYHGYTEMGQGLNTVMVQFASHVTGIAPDRFDPKVDATFQLGCGQTTGSRATLLGGRAVVAAARGLRRRLDEGARLEDLVGEVFAGDELIDDTTKPGAPAAKIKTHTTYGFATQVVVLDEAGRLERVIAAHDVGRAVNPALCEGQIEGAIHMGLGYALSEELPCDRGMPVTFKLRELGVLRARDMPAVEVILVEEPEPEGPFGAKGVGEIGLVPTAGAVAGALAAYDGVRRFRLPMKDSPAAKALSVGRIRARVRETWA